MRPPNKKRLSLVYKVNLWALCEKSKKKNLASQKVIYLHSLITEKFAFKKMPGKIAKTHFSLNLDLSIWKKKKINELMITNWKLIRRKWAPIKMEKKAEENTNNKMPHQSETTPLTPCKRWFFLCVLLIFLMKRNNTPWHSLDRTLLLQEWLLTMVPVNGKTIYQIIDEIQPDKESSYKSKKLYKNKQINKTTR